MEIGIPAPLFLIIGAPRAGTSWLKLTLALHPQVFMLRSEVHFFSQPERRARGLAAYHAAFLGEGVRFKEKFPDDVRRPDKFFGEKSPDYLAMDDEGIALLASAFPDVRLICMIRDPVERAFSHLRHLPDLLSRDPAIILSNSVFRQILDFGHYARHLSRWARHFPQQQMVLLSFADLAERPEELVEAALEHIGANPRMRRKRRQINSNTGGTAPIPPEIRAAIESEYDGERWSLEDLRSAWRGG